MGIKRFKRSFVVSFIPCHDFVWWLCKGSEEDSLPIDADTKEETMVASWIH